MRQEPINVERLQRSVYPCVERPEWMPGRDWAVTEVGASMLRDVVLQLVPTKIVESGTFTGVGAYTLAAAAQDTDALKATVDTIDYGINPDDPGADVAAWARLETIRNYMLAEARRVAPDVEIRFHAGHTRNKLPVVLDLLGGTWDLWFQDSGHLPSFIQEEWDIMAPAAHPYSVAILDDIDREHPFRVFSPPGWSTWWTPRGRCQLWLQKLP